MSEQNGHEQQHVIPPLGMVAGTPMHVDLSVVQANDGSHVVVLRLETAVGSWCQPLTPDFAVQLAEMLTVKAAEAREKLAAPPPPRLVIPRDLSSLDE